jgi:hypothetical protein
MRGTRLQANLRHIGWVEGVVAWVQDTRFGIAFVEQIDPKLAREPVATQPADDYAPRYVRPPLSQPEAKRLRKL